MDIRYTVGAGLAAVVMIAVALFFRTVGVLLCLVKTALNWKERLFCVIAYLPKATVQAAIGSVPMAMGLPCGQIVLSVAVMAILITAPLGALGMDTVEGEEGIVHEDRRTDIISNRNWFYLHQFRNVIMTQHMAFYTKEAVESMVRCGVEGIVQMEKTGSCSTMLTK